MLCGETVSYSCFARVKEWITSGSPLAQAKEPHEDCAHTTVLSWAKLQVDLSRASNMLLASSCTTVVYRYNSPGWTRLCPFLWGSILMQSEIIALLSALVPSGLAHW